MRRLAILLFMLLALLAAWPAAADGPSGSRECHIADDDCDLRIDEDPIDGADNDGDGAVDEDPPGDAANDSGENQVDCNEASSRNIGGVAYVYAGANGAEVCGDGTSSLPIDGRAVVSTDQGGYAAADGDGSNTSPINGYARVDRTGLHCGDENNQDSTASQTSNGADDCG